MSSSWRHPGKSGALLYALLATLFSAVLAVFGRVQVQRQRGRVDVAASLPSGPIIVISNHTSYADGVLLALVCRRHGRSLRLLATSGVFGVPLIGRIARQLGFIAVQRNSANAADALDEAAAALAAGEAIGLFPEGRLTRNPNQWPERAKTGVARLALRTDAPVVPVAMDGAYRLLGRRRIIGSLLANLIRRPKVATKVGAPIDVRSLLALGPHDEATAEQVRAGADHLMEQLIDLVEDLRGEQSPHPVGAPRAEAS